MTEPLRILQVLASLDRGGAETVVMDWLRRMDRRKITFDFVVNEGGPYAFEEELTNLGGRVVRAPKYRGWNSISYALWWKTCLANHPEWRIVHAHHTVPAFIYLAIARAMGRVTVAHSHTAGREKSLMGLLRALMRSPLRRVARYHMACSTRAGDWMFGEQTPVRVVHNGVSLSRFAFDAAERKRVRRELDSTKSLLIGHVGSFTWPKNHTYILRVFTAILEREPDARLVLVGDGVLRARVIADAQSLGVVDRVTVTGIRHDIPALLSGMDALLFPSHFEGLPVVVIEAQAAGLPCVVSNAVTPEVALTELVTFMSLNESEKVWAQEVIDSARRTGRHSRIDELREAGYDVSEVASEIQDLYSSLAVHAAKGGDNT